MSSTFRSLVAVCVFAMFATGCPPRQEGAQDGGAAAETRDAGMRDAGEAREDAGMGEDAGDAGEMDAGDAGEMDAGEMDAGEDAGQEGMQR